MPDKSRVPERLAAFDVYINNTDRYLQAIDPATALPHWQRLELKPDEAAWWHDQRVYWRDTLNKERIDKTKRTMVTTAKVENFRKVFKKGSAPILDKIAVADKANNLDEAEFNLKLKKNRKKPTYHQVRIGEDVMVGLNIIGGGRMQVICRTSHDSNRPSIPAVANSVEIAYCIGVKPNSVDDTTHRIISTRARFDIELGYNNTGKHVFAYARWYNTKHPLLAGTWSNMVIQMIG
jgi:hypothetical protein